jgi:hypothetical protein
MQFSEMVQWVTRTTKRPDKVDDIKSAINGAIEHFSLAATFAADLVETSISINALLYAQSLDITTQFTRFRKMKYIKRTDQKGYIYHIDSQNVFDKNGCEQLDRWYRAGNNIVFKMKLRSASLEVGYYSYPALLITDTDTNWMLDVIKTIIHDKASSRVFYVIGENADADRYGTIAEKDFIAAKEDLEDSAEVRS